MKFGILIVVLLTIGILVFPAIALRPLKSDNVRLLARPDYEPAIPTNLPETTPTVVGPVRSTDELNTAWVVGSTWLDWFSRGAHNRYLERDTLGGMHVTWMNARASGNGDRVISYNYREPNGGWSTPSVVFNGTGSGFPSIDLLPDGRAVVAAHHPVEAPVSTPTLIGVDDDYQLSAFRRVTVPNPEALPNDSINWPMMTIDHQNRAHLIGRNRDGGRSLGYFRLFYARSDTGVHNSQAWSYAFRSFEHSYALASSRISDKVAIAWPSTMIPNAYVDQAGWRNFQITEYCNDLWIARSTNGGSTWNFDDSTNNITRFRGWSWDRFNLDDDTLAAAGDTFRFMNDAAMVYDNQDHLHIVFNCIRVIEDMTIDTTQRPRTPPISRGNYFPTLYYHWTDAHPDTFSVVADGWWFAAPNYYNQYYRTTIDRTSLSISTDDKLYCAFTRYAEDDTSANGYPCGNVWVTVSTDTGMTWYYPTPITDTTPNAGAASGSAHSRIWPTLPEVTNNDSLYVMYFDDRSGGSTWIDGPLSGSNCANDWTLNQVYVQSFPRNQIRMDSTLTYPDYPPLKVQGFNVGVKEPIKPVLPYDYALSTYPNPFNPVTTVRFTIPRSGRVTVKVYDLAGREVTTLADKVYPAGSQRVIWQPYRLSSGVYFVKMIAGNYSATQKIIFMK